MMADTISFNRRPLAKSDESSSDEHYCKEEWSVPADELSCTRELSAVWKEEDGGFSNDEERIERSKRHWTQHLELDSNPREEMEPRNDEEVFEALQRNPDWGTFFHRFRQGELVMAEKPFAAGAQAEVYAAQIRWYNLSPSEEEQKNPWQWVLKVFKKGEWPLQALQKQWPKGMLQFQKETCRAGQVRRYTSDVLCGMMLEDGRFAFLMQREKEDLRHCIERNMKCRSPTVWRNLRWNGPFPVEVAIRFMYEIGLGMKWLHDHDILHRDLKASNVLLSEDGDQRYCFVADYECSEGLAGTEFWRAPEILRAIKSKAAFEERKKLFTKAADVYSYGMTCYEILTGKIPFEGHKASDYDVVLERKAKLEVPNYVPKWLHELLSSCWQLDPKERPTFEKILEEFEAHGGSCVNKDSTHFKYNWSQSRMAITFSPNREPWARSDENSSDVERNILANTISYTRQLSVVRKEEDGGCSDVEERIERSKRHWTQHLELDSDPREEMEPRNDEEVFEALQRNPDWGTFFHRFRQCELVMAEKPFAAGAQAEVYAAQIKWYNSSPSEEELKNPRQWVLKVFKKGEWPLQALQKQWPQGMLQFQKERCHVGQVRRYTSDVVCGTLLEDGRFAFLMQREKEDLRHCIERNMEWRPWTVWRKLRRNGPFGEEVGVRLMYEIALGMKWLHDHDILHRDLKASNVLLNEDGDQRYCFVADYECSEGLAGTEFWRAPEILNAIKSRVEFEERKKLFTKASDVYSYGMTCYEILTGKVPFEGHKVSDYDVVLEGKAKLEVPNYVPKWLHELLSSCWQFDPKERPTFEKILEEFEAHEGSCVDKDSTHSKYNWSQLILTIRMSMLSEFEEFWSAMETNEYFHTALYYAFEIFIQSSIAHWSILSEGDHDTDFDIELANKEVFRDLQMHPDWGTFFRNFNYDTEVFLSSGMLELGEKIAEGGQAEIFKAHVRWVREDSNEYDHMNGREWVLKVYKEGASLDDLQHEWPRGMFTYHAEKVESTKCGYGLKPRNVCDVVCGTLLEDGRFAFLLERYQGDLRQLIMFNMELRSGYDCGPFSKEVAEGIIFMIALGMEWLHSYDIVHRDIKAANVLVTKDSDGAYQCFVCDYESSIAVLGTGYWRAPELLKALKERTLRAQGEALFGKAIDVYSFGMTCYEVLTGLMPFENMDIAIDLVIDGCRPEVPKYIDNWIHELLSLCWRTDPETRPLFKEILESILLNSEAARQINERRWDNIEVGYFSLPIRNEEIFLGESIVGFILGKA